MILIAGPPGAGKSMQAARLEDEYAIKWLSMGQLLRDSVDDRVREVMERGDLVQDELAQEVLSKAVDEVPLNTRVLLDGFPRRMSQVNWFLDFMQSHQRDLQAIIHLRIPLEVSLDRLSKRGRQDDREVVIRHRYELYEEEILPMLEHLRHSGVKVINIDGDQPVESVFSDISAEIEDYLP